MKLHSTDHVIYDKANDHVVQFSNGDVIIYGNKEEALNDCRGNESVIPCTDLPKHWQDTIIKQLSQ